MSQVGNTLCLSLSLSLSLSLLLSQACALGSADDVNLSGPRWTTTSSPECREYVNLLCHCHCHCDSYSPPASALPSPFVSLLLLPLLELLLLQLSPGLIDFVRALSIVSPDKGYMCVHVLDPQDFHLPPVSVCARARVCVCVHIMETLARCLTNFEANWRCQLLWGKNTKQLVYFPIGK